LTVGVLELKCMRNVFIIVSFPEGDDIIDEALTFFKANVFFRNYEIKVMPQVSNLYALTKGFFFTFLYRVKLTELSSTSRYIFLNV
jgi:hypothetical protein